jgi:hypothetical protein
MQNRLQQNAAWLLAQVLTNPLSGRIHNQLVALDTTDTRSCPVVSVATSKDEHDVILSRANGNATGLADDILTDMRKHREWKIGVEALRQRLTRKLKSPVHVIVVVINIPCAELMPSTPTEPPPVSAFVRDRIAYGDKLFLRSLRILPD